MAKDEKPQSEPGAAPSSAGTQAARILAILGVNAILVLMVVVFTATERGELPDLNAKTLQIGLLPVSAAIGLILACRRIDLALPAVLGLLFALHTNTHILSSDPTIRLATLCGIGAGIGLASAIVTWFGRISSALWTALLAIGLWFLAMTFGTWGGFAPAGWPWPAALAASLGVLIVGGALLGATGLVVLPSQPPIIRSGSGGIIGLTGAWMIAGISLALAAQSEIAHSLADRPQLAYPPVLAAAALGGAYILRGRWGAPVAVILTGAGHLAWSFALSADLGSKILDLAVPAAAPLVAVPLYLAIDWAVRHSTSESAPTGILA